MIGYLDWAEQVLRVVLRERPLTQPLSIPALAAELGLPFSGRSDQQRNEVTLALDRVIRDLVPFEVVDDASDGFTIGYAPGARRFRTESLKRLWPPVQAAYLDADELGFLTALARLSEQPGKRSAAVADVRAEAVFALLMWDWDGPRALGIFRNLEAQGLVAGTAFPGYSIVLRVTYMGLVRLQPPPGPNPVARPVRRSPGRPRGSHDVTRDQIVNMNRQLKTQFGRSPTQLELCAHLVPPIGVRTLRACLADYDLPWPIE